MQLIKHKAKIAEPFMLKMIEEKVNKGSTKEKQEWEVFQEVYTLSETLNIVLILMNRHLLNREDGVTAQLVVQPIHR